MYKRVAYTGVFDPLTGGSQGGGHLGIVRQAVEQFEITPKNPLILGVGENKAKPPFIARELRPDVIMFGLPNDLKGLVVAKLASTTDLVPERGADIFVRGIRNYKDLANEHDAYWPKFFGAAERANLPPPELVFLTASDFGTPNPISSSAVRDLLSSPSPSFQNMARFVTEPLATVFLSSRQVALENTGYSVFDPKKPEVVASFNKALAYEIRV